MVDDKDRAIIDYFSKDPKIPYSQAAKELDGSKMTIKRRIDRLKEDELAKAFLCMNLTNLGMSHALSFVEITDIEVEKAILKEYQKCPLVTTVFSVSGFEYNLIICLAAEKKEQIDKFIDVYPLSHFDAVKRRSTYFAKKSEGFAEEPFWVPLAPDKEFFKAPWCNRQCEACPLVEKIKKLLSNWQHDY